MPPACRALLPFALVLLAGVAAPGCARVPRLVPAARQLAAPARPCRLLVPSITWVTPDDLRSRAPLDAWCGSVGPPIVTARAPQSDPRSQPHSLVVISWNTHGGVAEVERLLPLVGAARASGAAVVLLLQEVVRRAASVPALPPAGLQVPAALHRGGRGLDVEALAARLDYSLFYVPSMRNGLDRRAGVGEDRGNAILSSLPVTDPTAVELPFGHQRRVAAAATVVAPGPTAAAWQPLRVVSFHLDTRRSRAGQAAFLARWLTGEQSRHGLPIIAAGDVNAIWGTRDAAFEVLADAVPVAECGRGRTNRWPWRAHTVLGWWRGRLDYVFTTWPDGRGAVACTTWPDYHGSDHLPVVLTAPLAAR